MDRRDFFKTMLATPLLAPLLLASKTTKNDCELYLIADDPQLFIPFLLKELQKFAVPYGRNFTLLNSHPMEKDLKQILFQTGWRYAQKPLQADLCFSFSRLRHKALPSFTLVRDGRIWDIRFQKLDSLWREMKKNRKLSSCLTIASFKKTRLDLQAGKYVSIYKDGRRIERVSLDEYFARSFNTLRGKITARVKDGKAWVSESSCRQKICIYSPPVSLAGERIICAPNHFLLEIQGTHTIDTVIG